MPNPNANPPELPQDFEAVKLTFKDGRTRYGHWNGSQWSSDRERVEAESILKWERLPDHVQSTRQFP